MVLGYILRKMPNIQSAMLNVMALNQDVCIWQRFLLENTQVEIQAIKLHPRGLIPLLIIQVRQGSMLSSMIINAIQNICFISIKTSNLTIVTDTSYQLLIVETLIFNSISYNSSLF